MRRAMRDDLLKALDFVVTGTGRSGTGYAAALFTAAGLKCGHERWFHCLPGYTGGQRPPSWKDVARALKVEIHRRQLDLRGDASWLAVPYLGDFGGQVFLQLRHPVRVVDSLASWQFFSDPDGRHRPYLRFASNHFEVSGDDILDAMRWWIAWNRYAEPHADVIYHLETMQPIMLARMLDRLGATRPYTRASAAYDLVPSRGVNGAHHLGYSLAELSWDDLPAGPVKDELAREASRFGYTPENPNDDPIPFHREAS